MHRPSGRKKHGKSKVQKKNTVTRLSRIRREVVQSEVEREVEQDHKDFLWPTVFYFFIES